MMTQQDERVLWRETSSSESTMLFGMARCMLKVGPVVNSKGLFSFRWSMAVKFNKKIIVRAERLGSYSRAFDLSKVRFCLPR